MCVTAVVAAHLVVGANVDPTLKLEGTVGVERTVTHTACEIKPQ